VEIFAGLERLDQQNFLRPPAQPRPQRQVKRTRHNRGTMGSGAMNRQPRAGSAARPCLA